MAQTTWQPVETVSPLCDITSWVSAHQPRGVTWNPSITPPTTRPSVYSCRTCSLQRVTFHKCRTNIWVSSVMSALRLLCSQCHLHRAVRGNLGYVLCAFKGLHTFLHIFHFKIHAFTIPYFYRLKFSDFLVFLIFHVTISVRKARCLFCK